MSSSTQLWEAWTLSKQLHKTPAELYYIRDELAAWSFNRAVTTFGLAVENDLHNATKDAKNTKEAERKAQRVMDKWLREPDQPGAQKFRDPGAAVTK